MDLTLTHVAAWMRILVCFSIGSVSWVLVNIKTECSCCFGKCIRKAGWRWLYSGLPKSWVDYYILICTQLWELMKAVGVWAACCYSLSRWWAYTFWVMFGRFWSHDFFWSYPSVFLWSFLWNLFAIYSSFLGCKILSGAWYDDWLLRCVRKKKLPSLSMKLQSLPLWCSCVRCRRFFTRVGVSDFHFRGHIPLFFITGGENGNYLLLKLISHSVW
jgi:hypothetical protein